MAKTVEPTPWTRATVVARAQTKAVCELGIPPMVVKLDSFKRPSFTEEIIIFIT